MMTIIDTGFSRSVMDRHRIDHGYGIAGAPLVFLDPEPDDRQRERDMGGELCLALKLLLQINLYHHMPRQKGHAGREAALPALQMQLQSVLQSLRVQENALYRSVERVAERVRLLAVPDRSAKSKHRKAADKIRARSQEELSERIAAALEQAEQTGRTAAAQNEIVERMQQLAAEVWLPAARKEQAPRKGTPLQKPPQLGAKPLPTAGVPAPAADNRSGQTGAQPADGAATAGPDEPRKRRPVRITPAAPRAIALFDRGGAQPVSVRETPAYRLLPGFAGRPDRSALPGHPGSSAEAGGRIVWREPPNQWAALDQLVERHFFHGLRETAGAAGADGMPGGPGRHGATDGPAAPGVRFTPGGGDTVLISAGPVGGWPESPSRRDVPSWPVAPGVHFALMGGDSVSVSGDPAKGWPESPSRRGVPGGPMAPGGRFAPMGGDVVPVLGGPARGAAGGPGRPGHPGGMPTLLYEDVLVYAEGRETRSSAVAEAGTGGMVPASAAEPLARLSRQGAEKPLPPLPAITGRAELAGRETIWVLRDSSTEMRPVAPGVEGRSFLQVLQPVARTGNAIPLVAPVWRAGPADRDARWPDERHRPGTRPSAPAGAGRGEAPASRRTGHTASVSVLWGGRQAALLPRDAGVILERQRHIVAQTSTEVFFLTREALVTTERSVFRQAVPLFRQLLGGETTKRGSAEPSAPIGAGQGRSPEERRFPQSLQPLPTGKAATSPAERVFRRLLQSVPGASPRMRSGGQTVRADGLSAQTAAPPVWGTPPHSAAGQPPALDLVRFSAELPSPRVVPHTLPEGSGEAVQPATRMPLAPPALREALRMLPYRDYHDRLVETWQTARAVTGLPVAERAASRVREDTALYRRAAERIARVPDAPREPQLPRAASVAAEPAAPAAAAPPYPEEKARGESGSPTAAAAVERPIRPPLMERTIHWRTEQLSTLWAAWRAPAGAGAPVRTATAEKPVLSVPARRRGDSAAPRSRPTSAKPPVGSAPEIRSGETPVLDRTWYPALAMALAERGEHRLPVALREVAMVGQDALSLGLDADPRLGQPVGSMRLSREEHALRIREAADRQADALLTARTAEHMAARGDTVLFAQGVWLPGEDGDPILADRYSGQPLERGTDRAAGPQAQAAVFRAGGKAEETTRSAAPRSPVEAVPRMSARAAAITEPDARRSAPQMEFLGKQQEKARQELERQKRAVTSLQSVVEAQAKIVGDIQERYNKPILEQVDVKALTRSVMERMGKQLHLERQRRGLG